MNVKHIGWLALNALLLLQGATQEQDQMNELEKDVEMINARRTLSMDVEIATNLTQSIEQHEAEIQIKPETEPEAETENKPNVTPQAEPETEPETKPETEPESEIKTDVNPETEPATEIKTEPETETEPMADLPMTTATLPPDSTHPLDYQEDEAPQEATISDVTQVATTTDTKVDTVTAMTEAGQVNVTVPKLPYSCFTCTSNRNGSCNQYPHERQQCPLNGKRNGCYTMLKRDTELIMRGCASELTEEGDKYCSKEPKYCVLCMGVYCNKDAAPPSGSAQFLGSLTVWSVFLVASFVNF